MSRDIHHIANLNSLNDRDGTPQPSGAAPAEEELSMFTNTTFYDFDIGRSTDIATTVDELLMQQEKQIQYPRKNQHAGSEQGELANNNNSTNGPSSSIAHLGNGSTLNVPARGGPGADGSGDIAYPLDFSMLQEFSLAGELPPSAQHFYPQGARPQQHVSQDLFNIPADLHQLPPRQYQRFHEEPTISPSVHAASAPQQQRPQPTPRPVVQHHQYPESAANDSVKVETDEASKNSSSAEDSQINRHMAEEDKRRRNTAASARFRIKKKLREQEMERNTRQMLSRIEELESKLKQLEMENRWLKNLVVERNEQRDATDIEEMRSRILSGDKSS